MHRIPTDTRRQRRGEALLAELVPLARNRAEEAEELQQARFDGAAAHLQPFFRIDNIAGIEVYEGGEGYRVDLVFKDHPHEMDRLSSPNGLTLEDEEDAIEYALGLLVVMLRNEAFEAEAGRNPALLDTHLWFDLAGIWLGMPHHAFVAMREAAARDRRTPMRVAGEIADQLRRIAPAGITPETLERIEDGERSKLMGLILLALHKGISQVVTAQNAGRVQERGSPLAAVPVFDMERTTAALYEPQSGPSSPLGALGPSVPYLH
ncbi:hypothetical protein [Radicibacter daui]|uniref:hypothetical protein n=1 Tax=Radicibacter daui TaxID=3064829 RepID=UPI004046E474